MDKKKEIVRFENVYFSYKDHTVLEDITLSVFENDMLAVIGPNGGGKTTLHRLTLGLIKPTGETVMLFGGILRAYTLKNTRETRRVPDSR